MGVVRERKAVAHPENDEGNLDVEQSPSEAPSESEDDIEPCIIIPSRRRRRPMNQTFDDLSMIKSNTGKRKIRRYINKRILENLPRDDDDQDTLIEFYKGPFARLMETTSDAIEYLNDFCNQLESQVDTRDMQKKCCDVPLLRISHKIRRSLNLRKSFPSDKHKETEGKILDFFMKTPNEVFTKTPPNSFERLFLHAIAQYHDLHSINLLLDDLILVEIRNMKDVWIPVECNLCDFVQKKHD